MFSLDWIKAKTELIGPAHLIHEFVEYRHILDEKVYINMKKKVLKDMLLTLNYRFNSGDKQNRKGEET